MRLSTHDTSRNPPDALRRTTFLKRSSKENEDVDKPLIFRPTLDP
jgi:hypothetical protein